MQNDQRNTALFAIGAFITLVFIVVIGMFTQLLESPTVVVEDQATSTSPTTTGDPLVTVVPQEFRNGVPQPLDTDPARGASDPSVILMEFSDFECDACAQIKPIIEEVIAEYPEEVQHVWKDFPIPALHPQAETAAYAARCALDQGVFWEYHDELLENQDLFVTNPWSQFAQTVGMDVEEFETCLANNDFESEVVNNYFVARSLGLEQTPVIYVNNQQLVGIKTADELRSAINAELAE